MCVYVYMCACVCVCAYVRVRVCVCFGSPAHAGIWDVMTTEEVLDFTRSRLREQKTPALISEELTLECLKRNSEDNMSVIVIDIKGHDLDGFGETPSVCLLH